MAKEIIKEEKTKKEKAAGITIESMTEAGLQFGHKTSRLNPKMKSFLAGSRNGVSLFDLDKAKAKFEETLKFIQDTVSQGKIILFVGTKIQSKNLIKQVAQECGMPYITERWLGGTLTNIATILKRIEYFKELEKKRAQGELEKYTKKEKAKFSKELRELETKFSGIKDMTKLPDAVFVTDAIKDDLAIKEAKTTGVTLIGIADTNCDPDVFDYLIPANDDTVSSVHYILEKIKEVILKHKASPALTVAEPKA